MAALSLALLTALEWFAAAAMALFIALGLLHGEPSFAVPAAIMAAGALYARHVAFHWSRTTLLDQVEGERP
jgi:hypothetical protein